jgi:3-oxoacyl-[acyl-carrier protein] reductase
MLKKNVLITGGNKGIGLKTTKMFIDRGDHVFVLARSFNDFPYSDHPHVTLVPYDLMDVAGIPALIASLPPIDVLINNAGIMFAIPYDAYTEEKIDQMMTINLKAPVALISEVVKSMREKGDGRIVNNASIAGQIGHPDIWYGMAKASLINVTKSFAKMFGSEGIVVNAVAAGPVETDMLDTIPEPRKKQIKSAVYTGRFAYAEEVAQAMFWLATDSPEYINGTCIDLNNGAFPR